MQFASVKHMQSFGTADVGTDRIDRPTIATVLAVSPCTGSALPPPGPKLNAIGESTAPQSPGASAGQSVHASKSLELSVDTTIMYVPSAGFVTMMLTSYGARMFSTSSTRSVICVARLA